MKTRSTVLIAAALLALVVAGCGGGGKPYGLQLPAHWQQRSAPHGLLAVYARDGKTALLTIRTEPGTPVISGRFVKSLDAQFRKRLKGYVPLSHRILVTKAGPAFYFSYTQKQGGRLTSILLVPGHGKSYVLDAVIDPGSKAAARDVASIFHSFVPR